MVLAWVTEKVETSAKMSSTRNAAGRTKKKIDEAMKRAYHIHKNIGQAARKKCRKAKNSAVNAQEKFSEFKDEMKSEVKFVLKKKWWVPLITFLFT